MIEGLEEFIRRNGIERTKLDGREYLVLYKAVRADFSSWYNPVSAGAYKPGTLVRCRKVDKDRNRECSAGLHVGTIGHAAGFARDSAPLIVEVLVRPRDVVCVPISASGKIRCRRLLVGRLVAKRVREPDLSLCWRKRIARSWSRKRVEIYDVAALLE